MVFLAFYGSGQWRPSVTPREDSAPPTRTSYPSSDLKVYSNKRFGFSFPYPKELAYLYDHLDGFSEDGNTSGELILQNFVGFNDRVEKPNDFQLILFVHRNNNVPLEEYPAAAEDKLGKMQISELTIDGVRAMKASGGEKSKAVPTVWMIKDNVLYIFQLSEPGSLNADWFDQILSGFKFSD